jgi:hypothetical protein
VAHQARGGALVLPTAIVYLNIAVWNKRQINAELIPNYPKGGAVKQNNRQINRWRERFGVYGTSNKDGNNGAFWIPGADGKWLLAIASDGTEWNPVRGYEGLYEVSTYGRVRAHDRTVPMPNNAKRFHAKHEVAQEEMKKGYKRVSLCRNAEINKIMVHRLVAEAFIPNPNGFSQINHRDGDKGNNLVTNLEWCTPEYNMHHAIEAGYRSGWMVREIEQVQRLVAEGKTNQEIADLVDRPRQSVNDIRNGVHRDLSPEPPARCLFEPLWEHVSVSVRVPGETRCPTWEEMCEIKDMFWDKDETVIQYHPAEADYVNMHPHTLHLWKPIGVELPTPPSIMVGVKS